MATINEEYIKEFSRAVGRAYEAYANGIGSETTPGTALWYINQIQQLAGQNAPYFGVLNSTVPGFTVSYDRIGLPPYVVVEQGQVAYAGEVLSIAGQQVSIARNFPSGVYTTGAHFGVRIGFPIAEAQRATQVYLTTVSADANVGTRYLSITDTSLVEEIGFPLQAVVGTSSLVSFSGWNSDQTALMVDPGFGNGTLPTTFYAGTRVTFVYQPRIQALVGMPVESGFFPAGGDPSQFYYYPPLPADWLPICDLLCQNPTAPIVSAFGAGSAINPTVVVWPVASSSNPVFSSTDANTIALSTTSNRAALRQVGDSASTSQAIRAFEQYTAAVANLPSTSVRSYFATVPFRATNYFARGVSFDGLERLEFPQEFAQAYYDTTKTDLQHTFAMFRGDLYDHSSILTGNPPATITLTSLLANPVVSQLQRGTYVYGVSAVLPNGETPPRYGAITASNNTPTTFVNEIVWPAVTNAIGYHVYRRATLAGDVSEYRLTSGTGLTGQGTPTSAQPDPDTDDTLGSYTAFSFVAAGGNQLGGVNLMLRFQPDVNGDALTITDLAQTITVTLHVDNSGSPSSTVLATGSPIPFSALATTVTELISQVDATLTLGATYWIKLSIPTAPSTGSIILRVKSATGASALKISTDNSTWTAATNKTPWFTLLGYLDYNRPGTQLTRRGLCLTGNTSIVPRQISVYVPPVDFTGVSTGGLPMYGSSTDASVQATETSNTKNELLVTVIAQNGASGTPITLTATVPQGSARGTRIALGTSTQLFDRVNDVQVAPGAAANLRLGLQNAIQWSVYDFITVETTP